MKGLSAKQKLIAASLTMVIGLVMIVGTTLAWFSLSTNPEVSGMTFNISGPETLKIARSITGTDPEYLDYRETISLTDLFSQYLSLVPVSTADLTNWFIPTYDEIGNLNPASEFRLDNTLEYANVGKYEKKDGELQYLYEGNYYTENELREICSAAVDSEAILSSALQNPKEISDLDLILNNITGYYVYTDVWLTTENQYGSVVHLSTPHYGVEGATENNDMGGLFGTYVLPKLGLTTDSSGNTVTKSLSRNSETGVRIGFQIYADESDRSKVTDWFIFEPNADIHSNYTYKPDGEDAYVIGFDKSSITASNGIYVPTNPISLVETGTGAGGVKTYTYAPAEITASHSIIQLASAWNTSKVKDALGLNKKLNSTYLNFFGSFTEAAGMKRLVSSSANGTVKLGQTISPFSVFADEDADDTSSLTVSNVSDTICTVEYGKYVKIRIFVWIEGQDTDCWNDVASGSFIVNLEFSETDLHPEGDQEYDAG